MLIYHYDGDTKRFTYAEEAQLDPKENEVVEPMFSTTIQPPFIEKDEYLIFIEDKNEWIVKKSLKGRFCYNEYGEKFPIQDNIDSISTLYTLDPPPPEIENYRIENSKWTLKTHEEIKLQKNIEVLNEYRDRTQHFNDKYFYIDAIWYLMYEECDKYKKDGEIGPILKKRIEIFDNIMGPEDVINDIIEIYDAYLTDKMIIERDISQQLQLVNN